MEALFALVWAILALVGLVVVFGVLRKSKSGVTIKEKVQDIFSLVKGD